MKEIIKQIPITTIILFYLYLCGSLYLYGYWSYFEIDISNIVSITDIPKSFVIPFLTANGIYLVSAIFQMVALHDIVDSNTSSNKIKPKSNFNMFKEPDFWLLVSFLILIVLWNLFSEYFLFWIISGLFYSFMISIMLERLIIRLNIIKYPVIRRYLIQIFVMTIVMSFSIGKSKGLRVHKNIDIKYINAISIDTALTINDNTRMKLLGFLGNKVIVSSLDNKKIIVLNQDKYDKIELENTPIIEDSPVIKDSVKPVTENTK